jgi:hypothetical protein
VVVEVIRGLTEGDREATVIKGTEEAIHTTTIDLNLTMEAIELETIIILRRLIIINEQHHHTTNENRFLLPFIHNKSNMISPI